MSIFKFWYTLDVYQNLKIDIEQERMLLNAIFLLWQMTVNQQSIFLSRCKEINLDNDAEFVINKDETTVWYDMPSERTIEFEGADRVDIKTTGNEKNRFAIV